MSEPKHDETDQQRLNETMRTLVELLVGSEIEAMRKKIAAVDDNLKERMDQLELAVQAESRKTLGELSAKFEKLEARLGAAEHGHDEFKQSHRASEAMLRGELDALCQGLSALQIELQQQTVATERISGLLDNLAGVFSTKPQAVPSTSPEQLDNEIDRVFEVRVNSEESGS